MSYSGSHHPFGHSDPQLLQNRVMFSRLQELQKQQQHDAKSQSPMLTHLSRFGQQASGGQTPNLGGGMAVNSSNIFAPNNMNWMMHHGVSSPMQGFSSNSYSHDQGLMMNPSLQQPDASFYGTPVASGRANMGYYSPLQGVSQDLEQKSTPRAFPYANSLFGDGTSVTNSGDSLQKNVSLLDYSGMHGQGSGNEFLHEKSKHPSDVELDPLEEKILFDMENSGWDSSLSKLAALDVEEYENSSGVTETMNPFSIVQSGSWSALMQSAVADVSSSDAGVQEELSGLSYQNFEFSTDNQPSNLVTGKKSSSYTLKTPPSSCDSIMSSVLPSFQQTGLQSSFERGSNKFPFDSNIEHWSHMSQSLQSQQQSNQYVYGQIQNRTSDHQYMSIADGTSNQKENKSLRYDGNHLKNGHMSVDTVNKNATQTYASQNYQGENSSDSYNSKVSHAYTAQPDSESSARSSRKSPNQPMCLSSHGADGQQECFSSIKSDDFLHTNIGSAIQVKHNQSEDALSKRSPASTISASMDSKNTPDNKANLVSDLGGTTQFGSAISQSERGSSQDIFSFQSSVFGDSIPPNFGNEQKRQTWWMPSSFGQSLPPLQGSSPQNLSARSSDLGNEFEISNQLEHKSMSDMSVPSESVSKSAEMSQQVSFSGITGFQNYASRGLRNTLPYMSHLNHLGQSQRNVVVDPCKVSYNLHNFTTSYFNGKDQSLSLLEPSSQNSEIAINGEGRLDKLGFDERKCSQNQGGEIFESEKKSEMRFGYDAISNLRSGAQNSSALYMQTVTNQQVLSSSMPHTNADNVNLILSQSRKRKFSTYAGLPWHVEVMQTSRKLPDISVAEQGWAKATNRLVEERVNENDTHEEMRPIEHSKKRLVSTSQLMQLVFQPPPPSILRLDATSDYELLVYFVSKVALADTCKLISQYGDMLINASSNGRNSSMKDSEVLVERAMKLESQIEGLDASLSTVDVRSGFQELEKFSLINHFAKYHGRLAQSNATNTQSPFLQRYVSPAPVPQKFPEGTKCLSL